MVILQVFLALACIVGFTIVGGALAYVFQRVGNAILNRFGGY